MNTTCDDINQSEFNKYTWKIIELMFNENNGKQMVKHQLQSFNDFILNKIEQIISGFNKIEILFKYLPECDDFKIKMSIRVFNPRLGGQPSS